MKNSAKLPSIFFLAVVLFFCFVPPKALAAKAATSGEVPKVEPLLPPPEGIYPNVQNNIQFQDSSHPAEETALPQAPDTKEQVDVDQAQESVFVKSAGVPASLGTKIFWLIFALAGVGFVAFSVFRNQKV
jgi:hypothetical protein